MKDIEIAVIFFFFFLKNILYTLMHSDMIRYLAPWDQKRLLSQKIQLLGKILALVKRGDDTYLGLKL